MVYVPSTSVVRPNSQSPIARHGIQTFLAAATIVPVALLSGCAPAPTQECATGPEVNACVEFDLTDGNIVARSVVKPNDYTLITRGVGKSHYYEKDYTPTPMNLESLTLERADGSVVSTTTSDGIRVVTGIDAASVAVPCPPKGTELTARARVGSYDHGKYETFEVSTTMVSDGSCEIAPTAAPDGYRAQDIPASLSAPAYPSFGLEMNFGLI